MIVIYIIYGYFVFIDCQVYEMNYYYYFVYYICIYLCYRVENYF